MPDKKFLAKIHILKKEKKIPEEDYRKLLSSEFGVRSSKDLDNYRALKFIRSLRDFHKDAYSPSAEQIWLLKDLWHQIYRGNHQTSDLNKFIFRHVKVSDIRFLDRRKAYECVEALKAMQSRRQKAEGRRQQTEGETHATL
jgi:hypothetical protein